MTETEVRDLIVGHVTRAGGCRALAREWKISPSFVSDLMHGRRGPGPALLKHLGLTKVVRVTYEPKGSLKP